MKKVDDTVRFNDYHGNVYTADSCLLLEKAWMGNEIELVTLVRGSYPGTTLKSDEIPSVRSIGYWDSKIFQKWGLNWHKNEGIEICMLESGNITFVMHSEREGSGDVKYELKPNDLTITRPWLSHKLGNPNIGPCRLSWLILDVNVRHPHQNWQWPEWIILNKADLEELTTILRQNESPVWKGNNELRSCFDKIGKIILKGGDFDSRLKILINNLLMLLLDLFRKGNVELNESLTESRRTVELFLKELGNCYAEPWTLVSMAEYCNLGKTQFSRYCNEITNCTPMTFLNNMRLNIAAKMLVENKEKSIIDIAFDVGFSSNQYFTTVFKNFYNKTPLRFREGK